MSYSSTVQRKKHASRLTWFFRFKRFLTSLLTHLSPHGVEFLVSIIVKELVFGNTMYLNFFFYFKKNKACISIYILLRFKLVRKFKGLQRKNHASLYLLYAKICKGRTMHVSRYMVFPFQTW